MCVSTREFESRVLKRFVHLCSHSQKPYNSQKVGSTQVSIKEWIDMQNMIYTHNVISFKYKKEGRLPWWLSSKESDCQCRRHRFHPCSRGIPHTVKQLSLCAATIEPVLYSLGAATTEAYNLEPRSPRTAATEYPQLAATRESPRSNKDLA